MQLCVCRRIESNLTPFIWIQHDVLTEADSGVPRLGDRAADRPTDRGICSVDGINIYSQVRGIRRGQRQNSFHIWIAQRNRTGRIEEDFTPETRVHIRGFGVPIHVTEGKIVATMGWWCD